MALKERKKVIRTKICQDDHWGFIDEKGKVVIPCQWEDVAPFLNGKAFVKDINGTWLRIDKKGNVVEYNEKMS